MMFASSQAHFPIRLPGKRDGQRRSVVSPAELRETVSMSRFDEQPGLSRRLRLQSNTEQDNEWIQH